MAILTTFRHRFYKNDGTVNADGKVLTYVAGTTTPTSTYTDSSAATPNANPIILDSKGEADIWVVGQIKVNVLESDNTQVTGWPVDNIGSGVSNNDANARWAGTAAGTANALTISPSPSITAYVAGQSFIFKSGEAANTAATTIAISGLSAIAVQSNGAACSGGEILANNWYQIVLSTTAICQISKIGELTLAELGAAALAGSATQTFSVAAATSAAHAVRADQIQTGSVVAFTTGGTGTAFTLTPAPALAAYTVNSQFSIKFSAACGAAPTINISGLGATVNLVKPLADGTYAQLDADDFPSGWISDCKLVSATEMLVSRLPRRIKTDVLTRDLTLASSTLSVTGLHFRPRVVRLVCNIGGTNILSTGRYMNANTGGGSQSCIYQHSAAGFYASSTKAIVAGQDGSNYQDVTVTPTADGFDLVFTKVASPTGTLNVQWEAEE